MVVPLKRLLLIRHAECEMNLHTKGFVGGQSNSSPLTPLGEQQAAALGRHLARQYPSLASSNQQLVHSSTAVRAMRTTELLLQFQGPVKQCVQATKDLLELSQGSWEGAPRHACYTPQVLQQIQADSWNFAAPGGESQKQLEDRVVRYISSHVLPTLEPGGLPALVVSHGLAIKCFLRNILGSTPSMTWKIQLDNTAVTEVMWCDAGPAAGWHVGRVNDASHLLLEGLQLYSPGQCVAAVQAAEGEEEGRNTRGST